MFEAFAESARRIIFLARCEAGRLRCDYIDLPHFVLGFILEDQGDGERHLRKSFGVEDSPAVARSQQEGRDSFLDRETATKLQSALSIFGPRAEPQPTHGDMLLTEDAKRALSAAFEHANGSRVDPLHLLWAVFADEKGPAAKALIENGVTREQVEDEIRRRKQMTKVYPSPEEMLREDRER